ncbi:tetraacyldisaccharide 4'-kinase [Halarcobacter bivalviorum]|uniref:Tetraacyldisaccharide 4'-kinase n=1 Tax=Halarcobacter bivalviorum TaxID=663364 RepID=A0AAX2ABM7_9BACT|nr:tetraacyldisaccharide 4'-kinase [Halarcobacter bivalviorum]AXH12204.1 tetraacyldisaccharide 4'-kinase [Halarcobacter bivalviorum]RXK11310.1 tetraacyldisaccharide 4'-kinase [Halarcobacter bivalviorum]
MKQKIFLWVEDYLFFPNTFQQIISFFLLPFTFIYMLIIALKRANAKVIEFGIPVVSVGNIIVGGSGKTPFTIFLAKKYSNACVILRGFGRESKGLYVVSNKGKILEDVKTSGDEAMLLANSLSNTTIIVSEDRKKAILKAKELGCKVVFLDDGFSKYDIKKFDILIRPKDEPTNLFCLPSGGYREPKMAYSYADLELKEGRDFKRVVSFSKDGKYIDILPMKLLLLTAISKPKRVLDFLPEYTKLEAFPDHHNFTQDDIDKILVEYKDYSIITTEKDFVKLQKFNLDDLYLMNLELQIDEEDKLNIIDEYIKNYK